VALSTKVAQALPGLNQLQRDAYDAITHAIARSPQTLPACFSSTARGDVARCT
jgi:hypothetical protein